LTRLWARMPWPVQIRTPSSPSAGAVPAILPFEGADPGFAAGPPFEDSAERAAVFVGLAGFAGSALAGDHHRAHAVADASHADTVLVRHLAHTAVRGLLPSMINLPLW
jgi:hypothetical protein